MQMCRGYRVKCVSRILRATRCKRAPRFFPVFNFIYTDIIGYRYKREFDIEKCENLEWCIDGQKYDISIRVVLSFAILFTRLRINFSK